MMSSAMPQSDGNLPGIYPAVVKTYDPKTRTCRVEIPGINSGGDALSEAEIANPIGDKSRSGAWETEIEILPDDTVWVMFIGGDARYPIITHWRNPRTGNSLGWRRWHHKNHELNADESILIKAGKTIKLEANGSTLVMNGDGITLNGSEINLN
jgi:hypothetical protein